MRRQLMMKEARKLRGTCNKHHHSGNKTALKAAAREQAGVRGRAGTGRGRSRARGAAPPRGGAEDGSGGGAGGGGGLEPGGGNGPGGASDGGAGADSAIGAAIGGSATGDSQCTPLLAERLRRDAYSEYAEDLGVEPDATQTLTE